MSDLVCVGTFTNRTEAEIARMALEAAGIRVLLSADDAGGTRPDIGLSTGGVRILVTKDSVDSAVAVLSSSVKTHEDSPESETGPGAGMRRRALGAAFVGTMGIAGTFASVGEGWPSWLALGFATLAVLSIACALLLARRATFSRTIVRRT